jgi:hypothetical protein
VGRRIGEVRKQGGIRTLRADETGNVVYDMGTPPRADGVADLILIDGELPATEIALLPLACLD